MSEPTTIPAGTQIYPYSTPDGIIQLVPLKALAAATVKSDTLEHEVNHLRQAVAELNDRLIERTQDMLAKQTELIQEARQAKRDARDAIAQAVRRMEAVSANEMWKTFRRTNSLKAVRAHLIAAFKGEGQAQEVPQGEAKAEPATKEAPVTFQAHGKIWTRHTPGDPRPCDGHKVIEWLLPSELNGKEPFQPMPDTASNPHTWRVAIGWREADEPAQEVPQPSLPERNPSIMMQDGSTHE
jgi:hypothetical protein